jgi:DNA-directed RNA polymerase subunit RPC12/RpoP
MADLNGSHPLRYRCLSCGCEYSDLKRIKYACTCGGRVFAKTGRVVRVVKAR